MADDKAFAEFKKYCLFCRDHLFFGVRDQIPPPR